MYLLLIEWLVIDLITLFGDSCALAGILNKVKKIEQLFYQE